jgi:hypothetical protein
MNIQEGMKFCVMPRMAQIVINLVDNTENVIVVDFTKPIKELNQDVFKQIDQSPLLGFTFFSLDKDPNHPRARYSRYSIPEQT